MQTGKKQAGRTQGHCAAVRDEREGAGEGAAKQAPEGDVINITDSPAGGIAANKAHDISGSLAGNTTATEEEFLKNYRPGDYERPSVTADTLVFTQTKRGELSLLLVRRGRHPFQGHWALPGGFVNIDESLDAAARRELFEETGLADIYMEQLATFGEVARDPRMRVISVAYLGLAPKDSLSGCCRAGDDAKEACLFQVKERADGSFVFMNEERVIMFSESELAFDHAKIIHEGVNRIRGKLNYTDIAFELLEDKSAFTMADLRAAYEAMSGTPYPASNFTRNITTRYIKPGKMAETGDWVMAGNGMKVAVYEYLGYGVPKEKKKTGVDTGEKEPEKAEKADRNAHNPETGTCENKKSSAAGRVQKSAGRKNRR